MLEGAMLGDRFRIITAALSSVLAVAFYASDHEFNVQNVLMGAAALISIAALVVPTMRQHAPSADAQTEVRHHRA
jgi:hypothetical protein